MYCELKPSLAGNPAARRAQELIGACVHCGFCLETCPTYLDSRDERDSPRGRIYLIKALLEQDDSAPVTQRHLDRCLQCRSCETTCPSGMRYGELADLARGALLEDAPRPALELGLRWLLRRVLTRPALFAPLLRLGQLCRPLLPLTVRDRIPARRAPGAAPDNKHPRRLVFLEGCVQRAATPTTVAAARRVLDRLGISVVTARDAGCCGAVDYHLGAHRDALVRIRRNIDAWWPLLDAGAEALVSTASGCGLQVSEYGRLLAGDPDYADKAARISASCRDLAEILAAEDLSPLCPDLSRGRIAVHVPCTLQHGLGLAGLVPAILSRLGFELATTREDHLCCGSAGTYSLLQPRRSGRLRQRKLAALTGDRPDLVVSANIGCQLHLQSEGGPPVQHWIELLDS